MIRSFILVTITLFVCAGCSNPVRSSSATDAVVSDSMEIDHLIYFVNDLDRAKRFYTETMGFELIDAYPGFARVRIGSLWVGLKMTEQNGEDVGRGPMMFLRVTGIQDVVDRLLRKGAGPLTVIREVPTGLITTILDSEGNAIGLYEPHEK